MDYPEQILDDTMHVSSIVGRDILIYSEFFYGSCRLLIMLSF